MAYIPKIRDTLLLPSGPNDHLYVVVTGISSTSTHLLVNFSSIKSFAYTDKTCLVNVGDHSFITTPSYVAYQFARIEMAHDLANGVDAGRVKVLDPVSSPLLDRIRAGIAASSLCAPKFQSYYLKNAKN
jgi:hypothetical protein